MNTISPVATPVEAPRPVPTPEPQPTQDPRDSYSSVRRAAEWVGGVTGRYGNAMFAALPSAVVGAVQRLRGNSEEEQATKLLLTTYLAQGIAVGAGTGTVLPHPAISTALFGLKGAAISTAQFDMQAQGGGALSIARAVQASVNESISKDKDQPNVAEKVWRGATVAIPAGCTAALPVGDRMGRGTVAGFIEGTKGLFRVFSSKSNDSGTTGCSDASLSAQAIKGVVGTVAGVGAGVLMVVPGLIQGERAALNLKTDPGALVRKSFVGQLAVAGGIAGALVGGVIPVVVGTGAAFVVGSLAAQKMKESKFDAGVGQDVCDDVNRQMKEIPNVGDAQYDTARNTVVGSFVGAAASAKSAFKRAFRGATQLV